MMNKSRNFVLASCVVVAFLTGIMGCMVESRDLEKKDTFVCKVTPGCMNPDTGLCEANSNYKTECPASYCAATADDSCLAGSVCIAASRDDVLGRCVLSDDVEHCHDNDNDGFYGADPGFEDQCGFTENSPKDCDDGDPSRNPKTTEFCDGIDNSCAGRVDSTCPTTGCDEKNNLVEGGTYACNCDKETGGKPEYCQPLIELCFGVGTVDAMLKVPNAVCSAKIGGVLYCGPETDGKAYYRIMNDDGTYGDSQGTSCPAEGSPLKAKKDGSEVTVYYTYDEAASSAESEESNKKYCNGYDSDCNGSIDCLNEPGCKCAKECVEPTVGKDELCFRNKEGVLMTLGSNTTGPIKDSYDDKELPDACKGERHCVEGKSEPVCMKNGVEISKTCASE